jgi:hypothetical protein
MATIRELLVKIISRAKHEHFESGIISQFERNFEELYNSYKNATDCLYYKTMVLGIFFELVEEEGGEILGESLKILGLLEDRETTKNRLSFIHAMLYNEDTGVRDAAISGMEHAEHPSSTSVLREYIKWEQVGWLREYAKAVLQGWDSLFDEEMIRDLAKKRASAVPEINTNAIGVALPGGLSVSRPGEPSLIPNV